MFHYQFNEETTERAIKAFGMKNQLRQLQEELCEMEIEIHKFFRGRPEHMVDEIADIFIVFNQVERYLGHEYIQRAIDRKQKKLKGYLDHRDEREKKCTKKNTNAATPT